MLQNLHTHTTLCDGKHTPRENIETAIKLGFDSLGFSSHAATKFRTSWEVKSFDGYISEINALKKEFSGKIEILLGAEIDYYSKGLVPYERLDYTIGSVHMKEADGFVIDYDHNIEATKYAIDRFYQGSSTAFAKDYYSLTVKMSEEVSYDIVGHFDLITKFNELSPRLIDTESREYRDAALEALLAVREKREFFEVNTGAISRGYRKTPYPEAFILKEMRAIGCKPVITSDSHDKDYLSCHFAKTRELLRSIGFTETYSLFGGRFVGEIL